MSDLIAEGLIPLEEAALLPGIPRKHMNTWRRWAKKGCNGVQLETSGVGSTLCTTRAAVARFFERCAPPSIKKPPTPIQLNNAHSRASRRLDSLGM
jgi:hypothetical protein